MLLRYKGALMRYVLAVVILNIAFTSSVMSQDRYKFVDISRVGDADVRRLEAGVDVWRRTVGFVANYEYSSGFATSLEQAWNGEWLDDTSNELSQRRATGTIVKRGTHMRFSATFESGSDVDPETGLTHFASEDIIQTDDIRIKFWPRQKSILDETERLSPAQIKFVRTEDLGVGGKDRKKLMDSVPIFIPNSFFSTGGNDGYVMSHIDVRSADGETLEFKVVEESDATTITALVTRANGDTTKRYDFTFNMLSKVPCLKEYKYQVFAKAGEVRHVHHQVLSDFVDCGNGCLMAKKLTEVAGPLHKKIGGHSSLFVGRRWESKNLGSRPPQESDFDILVPAGTAWLRYKPMQFKASKEPMSINPFSIEIDDIVALDDYDTAIEKGQRGPPSSSGSKK